MRLLLDDLCLRSGLDIAAIWRVDPFPVLDHLGFERGNDVWVLAGDVRGLVRIGVEVEQEACVGLAWDTRCLRPEK